ncbi:MAG: flagellin [Phycisphaeraceae bacterium]|nr:flagellin [Phycisphaeraceae bacterium]
MSRINTNVQSLVAQRVLGLNNSNLSKSLERLSTGLRINRGKDDPAGLIASEALRAELKATNAAIANAQRADQVVNIAEGGLQEISGLLTELQGLLTASSNSAGLSQDERQANQLQIDSILQTIDRISSSTAFQGMKLLNGNMDFTVESVSSAITDYRINAAKFTGSSLGVDLVVTQSAQQGIMFLSMGGTELNFGGANSGNFTIEITGSKGSRELSFASNTSLATIVANINSFTDVTGLVASVAADGAFTGGFTVKSAGFGSTEFVSVKVVNDAGIQNGDDNLGIYHFESDDASSVNTTIAAKFDSNTAANGLRDAGQDVGININGIAATSRGKTARINTDTLDLEVTLATGDAQSLQTLSAFTITGGGASFQLAGSVDIAGKVSLGIADFAVRKLGNSSLGFLNDLAAGRAYNIVDSDGTSAQKIVGEAIAQISAARGRLGAFQKNTVGATIRSLGIAVENTAAAESSIRDADFASETAELTRSQILAQASTQVLALANSQPQAALALLG